MLRNAFKPFSVRLVVVPIEGFSGYIICHGQRELWQQLVSCITLFHCPIFPQEELLL